MLNIVELSGIQSNKLLVCEILLAYLPFVEVLGLLAHASVMIGNGRTYCGMFVVGLCLAAGVLVEVVANSTRQSLVHDTQKWPRTNRRFFGVHCFFYKHMHTYMYIHTCVQNTCIPHTSIHWWYCLLFFMMVCDPLRNCYDLWHPFICSWRAYSGAHRRCVALWAHRCTGSRPCLTSSVATGALYAHRATQHWTEKFCP